MPPKYDGVLRLQAERKPSRSSLFGSPIRGAAIRSSTSCTTGAAVVRTKRAQ